jgi:hypothetical protein
MRDSKPLFVSSWVVLLVLSIIIVLASLGSLGTAYFGTQDALSGNVTLDQIREIGGEEAVDAFRGRRATAATWALAYGIISIAVILGPYRRGRRWAWWALLASLGLSQLLSAARAVTLGTTLGTGAAGILFGLLLLGLLAGAPRMFREASDV